MIFALDFLNNRELCTPKLSCHLRILKSLIALLFRCSMNVSSRTRLWGGFRYFKGHFRTRWCLRCVFCSVMHHCVVRRSGSVLTEITEPALEARSSRHVFIETLQSKDFLAILLICGNFQITAFWVHSSKEPKIILKIVPHQKQSGKIYFLVCEV